MAARFIRQYNQQHPLGDGRQKSKDQASLWRHRGRHTVVRERTQRFKWRIVYNAHFHIGVCVYIYIYLVALFCHRLYTDSATIHEASRVTCNNMESTFPSTLYVEYIFTLGEFLFSWLKNWGLKKKKGDEIARLLDTESFRKANCSLHPW